jgi:hypothetical protein
MALIGQRQGMGAVIFPFRRMTRPWWSERLNPLKSIIRPALNLSTRVVRRSLFSWAVRGFTGDFRIADRERDLAYRE